MRILYVALKYDYGNPQQGHSFEHHNFFDSLNRMGHHVLYFDLGALQNARGKGGVNQHLFWIFRSERPELMFAVPFVDELDPTVIKRITYTTPTPTVAWFCDDHWRFNNYTRHWAP